jgi:pimeloyl-ACP methyl ester carboxylesterase
MNPGYEAQMREVATDLREIVIIPGVGHWTQQEAPAATNDALLRFLRGLDG